jgi:hypothetical protein
MTAAVMGAALGAYLLAAPVPTVAAAGVGAKRDPQPADDALAHVEIDVNAPDADSAWDRVAAAVTRCEPVEATVWFAFGSMRLRARPGAHGRCQLDLELEREGDKRAFDCVLPAAAPFRLDPLGRPGARKQSPPPELPRDLAPHCKVQRRTSI